MLHSGGGIGHSRNAKVAPADSVLDDLRKLSLEEIRKKVEKKEKKNQEHLV